MFGAGLCRQAFSAEIGKTASLVYKEEVQMLPVRPCTTLKLSGSQDFLQSAHNPSPSRTAMDTMGDALCLYTVAVELWFLLVSC